MVMAGVSIFQSSEHRVRDQFNHLPTANTTVSSQLTRIRVLQPVVLRKRRFLPIGMTVAYSFGWPHGFLTVAIILRSPAATDYYFTEVGGTLANSVSQLFESLFS